MLHLYFEHQPGRTFVARTEDWSTQIQTVEKSIIKCFQLIFLFEKELSENYIFSKFFIFLEMINPTHEYLINLDPRQSGIFFNSQPTSPGNCPELCKPRYFVGTEKLHSLRPWIFRCWSFLLQIIQFYIRISTDTFWFSTHSGGSCFLDLYSYWRRFECIANAFYGFFTRVFSSWDYWQDLDVVVCWVEINRTRSM